MPFSDGKGLVRWVTGCRRAAIEPDNLCDSGSGDGNDGGGTDFRREYRWASTVPLAPAGPMLGVLLSLHASLGDFDREHLRLIETGGSRIARAINDAEFYDVIRGRRRSWATW